MVLSSGLCILILSSFTFRGPSPTLSVFILIKDNMCRARDAGFSFEGEQRYRFESVTSYPNSFPLFKSYVSFSELENIQCDHPYYINRYLRHSLFFLNNKRSPKFLASLYYSCFLQLVTQSPY